MDRINSISSKSDRKKKSFIGGIYRLKKKLGAGSFGTVYHGVNKNTSEDVAIKLEKIIHHEKVSVNFEAAVLKQLSSIQGIPQVLWSGQHENYEVLVLPLLGKDLGTYLKLLKRFPLKRILVIAFTLLKILEEVHKKGYIHRDLKPENIMMGKGSDLNSLYLIDFGISKCIFDERKNHIPLRGGKPFIGTCRYAPLAAHEGKETSRKDDLESLGYVLLYLIQGMLPWQSINAPDKERFREVGIMKRETSFEILCKDCPIEFIKYFRHVRSLNFSEVPNYNQLQDIFVNLAERENLNLASLDSVDWSNSSFLAIKKRKGTKRKSFQNIRKDVIEINKVNMPMTPQNKKTSKMGFEAAVEYEKTKSKQNVTKSSLLNPKDLSISRSGGSLSVSYSSQAFSQRKSICIEEITQMNKIEFEHGAAKFIVLTGQEYNFPEDSVYFKMNYIGQFNYKPNLISQIRF